MKRLLLLFATAAVALMMTGCQTDKNYVYDMNYVYENKSSTEITLHSVKPYDTDKALDSLFVIPINEQHTLSFGGFGYNSPFMWGNVSRDKEYVTVSNGEKIVTQKYADGGDLFSMESYAVIKEEDRHKTVEYVFTDKFFENGEPIE